MVMYHVVILNAIEFSFELSDFTAVSIHLIAGTGPVFVELVDDQHGISIYHEAFDAKLDGYTEFVETCFILGGVVGDQKVYLENISKLILGRRNEQNAAPAPLMLRAPSKYIT